MNRAQIDRQISIEEDREGLLGHWVTHNLKKNRRALRRQSRILHLKSAVS